MGSAAWGVPASNSKILASVNCRQSSDRSSVHGIFLTMISINVRAEETRVAGVAAPPLLPQHLLIWVPRSPARPGRGRLLLGAFSRTRSVRTWQK